MNTISFRDHAALQFLLAKWSAFRMESGDFEIKAKLAYEFADTMIRISNEQI